MIEITIMSETEITVYPRPGEPVKQRVITYLVPDLAPRTIWVDEEKLPDQLWLVKNPGKPIPPTIQAEGDRIRRSAIEADLERIAKSPGPRKLQ